MGKFKFAIMGELISSRKKVKEPIGSKFAEFVHDLNQKYSKLFDVPIEIYAENNFGCICSSAHEASTVVLAIQEFLRYQKLRVVLVEGEVAVIDGENVHFTELIAPAIWKGKQLLQQLRGQKFLFMSQLESEWASKAINTALNVLFTYRGVWKTIDWELYNRLSDQTCQHEIATQIGVSQQYISKVLRRSKIDVIIDAEKDLESLIQGIYSPKKEPID